MGRWWRLGQGIVLAAVLAGGLTGCGGGAKTAPVKGKVTYQGKALAFGSVIFMSQVPETKPIVAEIKPDGTYEAKTVPVGEAAVGVTSPDPNRPMELRGTSKRPTPAADPKLWFKIPDKYSLPRQSGLTYTVVDGPNEHNIDLR
jgi:hypothetical protein